MAIWTGSNLLTQHAKKHGFGTTDSAVLARVLEWINEIQSEICEAGDWPFLKFKMKKQFILGDQEIDLSPQIPSAPTFTFTTGGSLALASTYSVKVTFVLYDESLKEINSIESEPSAATTATPPSGANLTLSLSALDLYSDTNTIKPVNIQRRIYLSKDGAAFYLAVTIPDNTTLTATITADTASTIEPPEFSMVSALADEDPIIETKGVTLSQAKLGDLIAYSSNLSAKGTPYYYARIGPRKILLYPKPSGTITLSYWVYRVPSRIFNDATRAVQLEHTLKTVLDAGVTWKSYEYKDEDGVEGKLNNYAQMKAYAKGRMARTNGQANSVKEVC
jgi:hypothetical protein